MVQAMLSFHKSWVGVAGSMAADLVACFALTLLQEHGEAPVELCSVFPIWAVWHRLRVWHLTSEDIVELL